MVELPYEVWVNISQYLPDHFVRGLFSINSALLGLAMDLCYKEVTFQTHKEFVRIQDPFIAVRVRKLLLQPTIFFDREKPKPRFRDRIKQLIWRAPRPADTFFGGRTDQSLIQISTAFSLMSNLTHLHVHSYSRQGASFADQLPFMLVALTAFCPYLRKLTLSTMMGYTGHYALLTTVFPALEFLEIDISLYEGYQFEAAAYEATAALIRFINNHRLTLKSFIFTMAHFDSVIERLKPLFLGLGHFPHLGLLTIDIPWTLSTPFTQYFLPRHADGLHTLVIPGIENFGKFPVPVELPHLKALVLGLNPPNSLNLSGAVPFIRPLAASLTTLKMWGYRFPFHVVCGILGVFPQQHKLGVLDIELDFVTPQFFDVCSEKLPNLEKLTLSAIGYKDMDNAASSIRADEEMFCQQMQVMRYNSSNLRHLHINIEPQWGSDADKCNVILKELFPFMTWSSLPYGALAYLSS